MTGDLRVTRIVHSCHLIEIGGRTLLTDPWFSTTPTYHPGESAALTVANLPELDGVLITHEHYDHCDLDAFAAYRDLRVPLVGPATVVDPARQHGFTDVRELGVRRHCCVERSSVILTKDPLADGSHDAFPDDPSALRQPAVAASRAPGGAPDRRFYGQDHVGLLNATVPSQGSPIGMALAVLIRRAMTWGSAGQGRHYPSRCASRRRRRRRKVPR